MKIMMPCNVLFQRCVLPAALGKTNKLCTGLFKNSGDGDSGFL